MKNAMILTVGILAALCSAAAGEPSVKLVYRGHLTLAVSGQSPSLVDTGADRRDLTFRLYRDKADTEALWERTYAGVRLSREGYFEVVLADDPAAPRTPSLAECLTDGSAQCIGLTVGSAREIYPRREILDLPQVGRALAAGSVGADPRIGTVSAASAVAKTLVVQDLSVTDTLNLPEQSCVALADVSTGKDRTLTLRRGKGLTLFRPNARRTVKRLSSPRAGAPLLDGTELTERGLVHVYQASGTKLGLPGLVEFACPGQSLACPVSVDGTVVVDFYPFASR